MMRWFQSISYRGKLLLMNFMLIFIAIIIALVFYINGVSSAISFNVSYIKQFNEQLNMSLDMALEVKTVPNLIHYVDNDVEIVLRQKREEKTAKKDFEDTRKMIRYLNMISLSRQNTIRATIMTKGGDVYSSYEGEMEEYLEYLDGVSEELTWKRRIKPFYTPIHAEEIGGSTKLLVTAVYQIYDIGKPEGFAYLFLDMDFSEITKLLNSQTNIPENLTSIALIRDKEVIYNSQGAFINLTADLTDYEREQLITQVEKKELYDVTEIQGTSCVISVMQNESTGWYILQYLPQNALLISGMKSMIGIAVGLAILLVIALIISIMLANYVSRPVKTLCALMAKAKAGEVEMYEDQSILWKDEIGQLIESYNNMGQRINDSINRIYIYQINQKQTEIKMLQFQINPHFLYNSLHTISSIAKLEDVPHIAEIAERLSDMFRYNIKRSDFVTLSDEVEQVKNYIRIQSIRFHDRINVEYCIDEDAERTMVLKFILQPIVENSIQHAFVNLRSNDHLLIKAYIVEHKRLIIEIMDDGVGMSQNQVDELNYKLENTKTNTLIHDSEDGIGLTNVNARLKNYYGSEYGVHVKSVEGKYTCIYLELEKK